MDIVKRAYLQASNSVKVGASAEELRQAMVDLMVGWIEARVYSKRDWPSRDFGPYPVKK